MNIIKRAVTVLTKPREFFSVMKKETGYRNAWLYFAVLSLVFTALSTAVVLVFGPVLLTGFFSFVGMPTSLPPEASLSIVLTTVLGYAFGLAMVFVGAGLLHIWVLIFGGKGGYQKSFQLAVYASTPKYVFGWIPFIGGLSGIYDLILVIIGTQALHGISKKKAILMYVIPAVLFLIIWLVSMAFIYAMSKRVV